MESGETQGTAAAQQTTAEYNPSVSLTADSSPYTGEPLKAETATAQSAGSSLPEISESSVSNASDYAAAKYAAMLLESMGYNVVWLGLTACVRDFQQKNGLTVDGIIGEKTWSKLLG